MSSRASTPPPPSISPPPSSYYTSHLNSHIQQESSRGRRNRSQSSFSSLHTILSNSPHHTSRKRSSNRRNDEFRAGINTQFDESNSVGQKLWDNGADISDVMVRVHCREKFTVEHLKSNVKVFTNTASETPTATPTTSNYASNPSYLVAVLNLHSTILKQSEYFAARLSSRWKASCDLEVGKEGNNSTTKIFKIEFPMLDTRDDAEAFISTMNLMYTLQFSKGLKSMAIAVRILRICNEILWDFGIDECCRYIAQFAAKDGIPHTISDSMHPPRRSRSSKRDGIKIITLLEETYPLCDFSRVSSWFDSGFASGNVFSVTDLKKLLLKYSANGGDFNSEFISLEFNENISLGLASTNGDALVEAYRTLESNETNVNLFISKSYKLFRWIEYASPEHQIAILDIWINKCWDMLTANGEDMETSQFNLSPALIPFDRTDTDAFYERPRAELNSRWYQNGDSRRNVFADGIPLARTVSDQTQFTNDPNSHSTLDQFLQNWNNDSVAELLSPPSNEDVLVLIPGAIPSPKASVSTSNASFVDEADDESQYQDAEEEFSPKPQKIKGKESVSSKPSSILSSSMSFSNTDGESALGHPSMHSKPRVQVSFNPIFPTEASTATSSTVLNESTTKFPAFTPPSGNEFGHLYVDDGMNSATDDNHAQFHRDPHTKHVEQKQNNQLINCFSIVLRLLSTLSRNKALDCYLETKGLTGKKRKPEVSGDDDVDNSESTVHALGSENDGNERSAGSHPQPAFRGGRSLSEGGSENGDDTSMPTHFRARSLSSSSSRVVRFATTRRREEAEDVNVARDIAERRLRRRELSEGRVHQNGERRRHVIVFDDEEIIPDDSNSEDLSDEEATGANELESLTSDTEELSTTESDTNVPIINTNHYFLSNFEYTPDILDYQAKYALPKSSRIIINMFVCLFQVMRVTRYNVAATEADVLVAGILRNVLSMKFKRFLVALLVVHSDLTLGSWSRSAVGDTMRMEKWRMKKR
ncbi:hypothetical protein HK098_002157 [Nowakowskiella sp. JEL0407]|nr:hypothetical protein HK098_002157 [Nowakowskiella sp. JEL0407]